MEGKMTHNNQQVTCKQGYKQMNEKQIKLKTFPVSIEDSTHTHTHTINQSPPSWAQLKDRETSLKNQQ